MPSTTTEDDKMIDVPPVVSDIGPKIAQDEPAEGKDSQEASPQSPEVTEDLSDPSHIENELVSKPTADTLEPGEQQEATGHDEPPEDITESASDLPLLDDSLSPFPDQIAAGDEFAEADQEEEQRASKSLEALPPLSLDAEVVEPIEVNNIKQEDSSSEQTGATNSLPPALEKSAQNLDIPITDSEIISESFDEQVDLAKDPEPADEGITQDSEASSAEDAESQLSHDSPYVLYSLFTI